MPLVPGRRGPLVGTVHRRRLRRRRRRGRRRRLGGGRRRGLVRRRRGGRRRVGRRRRRGRRLRVRPDGPTIAAGTGLARGVLSVAGAVVVVVDSGSVVVVVSVVLLVPDGLSRSLSFSFSVSFSSSVVAVVEGAGGGAVVVGAGGTVVVVVGDGGMTWAATACSIAFSIFGSAAFLLVGGNLDPVLFQTPDGGLRLRLVLGLDGFAQLLDVLVRVIEGRRVDGEADRVGDHPDGPGQRHPAGGRGRSRRRHEDDPGGDGTGPPGSRTEPAQREPPTGTKWPDRRPRGGRGIPRSAFGLFGGGNGRTVRPADSDGRRQRVRTLPPRG